MREMVMARTLALGPVPDVMNLQDPERPRRAHEHTQRGEDALEWFAAIESSVNQASVHALGRDAWPNNSVE